MMRRRRLKDHGEVLPGRHAQRIEAQSQLWRDALLSARPEATRLMQHGNGDA
jgi:hypothetical protein